MAFDSDLILGVSCSPKRSGVANLPLCEKDLAAYPDRLSGQRETLKLRNLESLKLAVILFS
jgi:hypothetical protein